MPAGPKPRGADRARADLSRDLALPDGAHVGDKTEALALSGAAFVKARCFSMAQPFDPRLDAVGCSDALFFRRLAERGHRLVWSMGARVTAHVPAESTEPAGLMWQRYLSGQCRCLVPMLLDPPRRAEAAFQTMKSGAAVALSAPVALAGRALGGWPPRATGLLMSGLGTIAGWRLAAVLSGRGGR